MSYLNGNSKQYNQAPLADGIHPAHEFKVGDRVRFGTPVVEGYVSGLHHPYIRIAAVIRGEWVDGPWRPTDITPITGDHGDPLYEIGDEVEVRGSSHQRGTVVWRDSYRGFGESTAVRRVLVRWNPSGNEVHATWMPEGDVRFVQHTSWRSVIYPAGTMVRLWSDRIFGRVPAMRNVARMSMQLGRPVVEFTDNSRPEPAWNVECGLGDEVSSSIQASMAMDEETFVTQYGWLLSCLPADGTSMTLASPKNHWNQVCFERVANGCVQFKRYGTDYGDPCLPHEAARKLFAFFLGEQIDESTTT